MTRFYAVGLILVMVSFGAVFLLQTGIDESRDKGGAAAEFMYLPDADYIRAASLGYDTLSADLIWLKAIQTLGKFRMTGEDCDWSYKALDTATSLDPYFTEAYELGGLVLTLNEDKVDLADDLLEKGVRYNPDVWQLHYYLGFNLYYFQSEYDKAAVELSKAAEIDGSPWYLPYLASRVSASAGRYEFGIEFLQRMYEQVDDERLKEKYLKRINELKSAMIISELQKAVDKYKITAGGPPSSLAELVNKGAISGLPEDPSGGEFYIDAEGVVRSTTVGKGIKVYKNR